MEKILHIKDSLDKNIIEQGYVLGTRFGQGTLLVYIYNEDKLDERTITIEKYFEISKKRNVKFEDFNI